MKNSTKRNILVTGAEGQLGKSLRKIAGEFPDSGFVFPDEKDADILVPDSIRGLLRKHKITDIINCAAYTAVDRAEEAPQTARKINAEGTGVLASICREEGIRLVHISTDYVFDGLSGQPYREESPVNPLGVYGRTKLEGEEAIREVGCDAVVIRTSWLYSEFGNNFVLTMLRLAGEGKPLRVVADQCGTPTYATDLARAAAAVIEKGFKGFDLLHYSALGHTTWYGFAGKIFEQAGIEADLSPVDTAGYPTRAVRPKNSIMSMDKALRAGLPLRPWEEALAECIGNINSNKLLWISSQYW